MLLHTDKLRAVAGVREYVARFGDIGTRRLGELSAVPNWGDGHVEVVRRVAAASHVQKKCAVVACEGRFRGFCDPEECVLRCDVVHAARLNAEKSQ